MTVGSVIETVNFTGVATLTGIDAGVTAGEFMAGAATAA
jgi:hypothetical protein